MYCNICQSRWRLNLGGGGGLLNHFVFVYCQFFVFSSSDSCSTEASAVSPLVVIVGNRSDWWNIRFSLS